MNGRMRLSLTYLCFLMTFSPPQVEANSILVRPYAFSPVQLGNLV